MTNNIHNNKKKADLIDLSIIKYNAESYKEYKPQSIKDCLKYIDNDSVTWINFIGSKNNKAIAEFGKAFNLHPIVVEDIVKTKQRPRVEDFKDYLFIILKMISFDHINSKNIINEQVSIIVGNNFIITFQEKQQDVFDNIREKLKNKDSKIRKLQKDYLLYSIIDSIITHYFISLEKIGDEVDKLEDKILGNSDSKIVKTIHKLRRQLIHVRKSVWPLREILNTIEKGELSLILKDTLVYFRSLYEHTVQLIDTIETYRDMVTDMLDIYLSSVSNKTNDIMKVLTIISTFFIPLTFITGLYGMNFLYMPELKWRYGYYSVLGVMLVISVGMIVYFKKKKWL